MDTAGFGGARVSGRRTFAGFGATRAPKQADRQFLESVFTPPTSGWCSEIEPGGPVSVALEILQSLLAKEIPLPRKLVNDLD